MSLYLRGSAIGGARDSSNTRPYLTCSIRPAYGLRVRPGNETGAFVPSARFCGLPEIPMRSDKLEPQWKALTQTPVSNSTSLEPNSLRRNTPRQYRIRDQVQLRSCVRGSEYRAVASSIISTTPSTLRSAGFNAPIGIPDRLASDERTCSASNRSPSISLLLSTSDVSVSSTASCRRGNPSASIWPI